MEDFKKRAVIKDFHLKGFTPSEIKLITHLYILHLHIQLKNLKKIDKILLKP